MYSLESMASVYTQGTRFQIATCEYASIFKITAREGNRFILSTHEGITLTLIKNNSNE